MGEWQPIETAPKDGTTILLSNGYHMAVARWDENFWNDANFCWSISDWHNEPLYLRGGYSATHWMPLPPLPQKDERR
jgi:hypothetical protein